MCTRKRLRLPFHVGHRAALEAVVIQAGLANAHHFGKLGAVQQVLQGGFLNTLVVRVHANRGPEVVEPGGQGMNLRELFQRGADAQGAVNLCLCHLGTNLDRADQRIGEN